jgi:hypothetical protein
MRGKPIHAPLGLSTAEELRFVARAIDAAPLGSFWVGLGRTASVMQAFGLAGTDAWAVTFCELDATAVTEDEKTRQVLLLMFASFLLDDICPCCGAPLR